jgi:hypothetical protein
MEWLEKNYNKAGQDPQMFVVSIIIIKRCFLTFRPPLWSSGEFLATDPEVLGSISGATIFSEK